MLHSGTGVAVCYAGMLPWQLCGRNETKMEMYCLPSCHTFKLFYVY